MFVDKNVSLGLGVVFPVRNSSSKGDSTAVLFSPTIPGTSLFILPNVVWKNEYQTGFEANALYGFSFLPHVRLESEFLYQTFKRKISGHYDWAEINVVTEDLFVDQTRNPIHKAKSRTNIYCLLSNFLLDYKYCGWNFYAGGGMGIAWLHSNHTIRLHILEIHTTNPSLNITARTIEKSPSLYGTACAWQVKAGLSYELRECVSIGLNYRLFGTTRFLAEKSSIITNPFTDMEALFRIPQDEIRGFLNHSVNFSIQYQY